MRPMSSAEFVRTFGDPVEPPCPKCGGKCYYNGNYLCSECDWGLPHPDPVRDRPNSLALHEWAREAYISLMKYRDKEPKPEALKLEYWRY